ncbi:polysaccharide lyase 8 family protein [Actinacidiphila sp. bgisy144]|uniref:polysaccharide lyase 8 family protein n=1 Tax=Actinacidiphila sp. bgisy144 TaxID=3413791 RepID=UPI003EBAF4E7
MASRPPYGTVSRRGLLLTAGASAFGLALAGTGAAGTPAYAGTAADADPYATVRAQWAALVSGGAIDPSDAVYTAALAALDSQAATVAAALDTTAARTRLFTDLPLGADSANVTASLTRLQTLALAYATPGTARSGDATLRQQVLDGMDFVVARAYTTDLPRYGYGNWWDWQIGAPQALQDTANLLYPALGDARIAAYCAAIDHFVPDPTVIVQASGTSVSTGANRLDLCRVLIIRGALGADASKITTGVAAISPTLPFVTTGDGLYADGSFLQHTYIAYTGTYGAIWLGDVAKLMSALAGTSWQISDPQVDNVFFAATDAFAPVVYNGLMLDAVRGRAVSRATESGAADGLSLARTLATLAPAADPQLRARLNSTVKGWLQRTPTPLTSGSVASIALLDGILGDSSVPAAAEPVGHRLFPAMDRAVHRRKGWAASISMASDRIGHYETGGNENLRGWHTGSGMTQLHLDSDNTQYDDGFWPTVDPYRLPGTTASLLPLADGQGGAYAEPRPTTAWVGGATDGEYAAIGQDLQGPFSTLTGKKSWFCLDDAVVCLDAGITCADGTEVDTVVDNRNLHAGGTNALTVDGAHQPGTQGTRTYTGARWAAVEGVAGYVFPERATLTAVREPRTGSWHDINTGQSATPLTRDYLTLYVDHGVDPVDAHCSYVVLPGARAAQTAARAADRDRQQILANCRDQQGIHVPSLGLTAVNFFAAGTVGPITASAPVCVLIREHRDGTATVCVADPARQATALTVTWHRPVRRVTARPDALTAATTGRTLRLVFGDLTGLVGATQQTTVRLG